MNANERFDKVTILIEQEIRTPHKSASAIAEKVAKEIGMSERDLSIVFNFISGKSLIAYIRDRKMMTSYETLLNSKNFNVSKAVEISGLGDQSAYNKCFKKMFGCTPKEAFNKKDSSLLKVRLSWDNIQTVEIASNATKRTSKLPARRKIFGMDRSKFDEIKEIIKLQDIFGFDELQSETAYYMYDTYNIELKDAFVFVDEFHYNIMSEDEHIKELKDLRAFFNLPEDYVFAEEEDEEPRLSREEYFTIQIKEYIDNPEIRYVYFNGDMESIYTVFNVIEKIHSQGESDVTKLDIDVINICADTEMHVGFCKKAIKYYKEHATDEYGEEAFEEFIEALLRNIPIETAFDNIMHLEGGGDYPLFTLEELESEDELFDYEETEFYDDSDNSSYGFWDEDEYD